MLALTWGWLLSCDMAPAGPGPDVAVTLALAAIPTRLMLGHGPDVSFGCYPDLVLGVRIVGARPVLNASLSEPIKNCQSRKQQRVPLAPGCHPDMAPAAGSWLWLS